MYSCTHYKQDPIYLFPEMKLRDLVHNFHIHVFVNDLNIPTIGPNILLQNGRTDCGNITARYMNVEFRNETTHFHFWKYLF